MARLAPYAFMQELDNNGYPLVGGKIYTYEAGTTTPKATYTDASATITNANPVILDGSGRAAVWLGDGAYKLVLKTAADVTIKTIDNITGESANAFGSNVNIITSNTSITAAYANSSLIASNTITLTLPPVDQAGQGFYFTIKNNGSGIVTIDPDAAELIDGVATKAIGAGYSALVICNGSAWYTLFLATVAAASDNTFTGTNTFNGTSTFNGTTIVPDGTVSTTAKLADGIVTQAKISAGYGLVPSGAILGFAMSAVPSGWLECDGSAVSRTTYAALFSAISTMYGVGDGSTTFNLPDYRGEFLRGYDHGRGADPDAATRTNRGDGTTGNNIGTKQTDAFKSHTHTYNAFSGGGLSAAANGTSGSGTNPTSSVGGTETRPRNVYVMYCIKT